MRFVIILFFASILSAYSQSEAVAGLYSLEWIGSNGESKREIILNPDGTFVFHTFERHDGGLPPERNFYAKGRWIQNKKVISFSANATDLDNKYNLNFNGTKARFSTRSPRDKSNRLIKTYLIFFESEVSWVKGMKLFKE